MKLRSACIRNGNLTIVTVKALIAVCLVVFHSVEGYVATTKEIDVSVDVALKNFHKHVKSGKEFFKIS